MKQNAFLCFPRTNEKQITVRKWNKGRDKVAPAVLVGDYDVNLLDPLKCYSWGTTGRIDCRNKWIGALIRTGNASWWMTGFILHCCAYRLWVLCVINSGYVLVFILHVFMLGLFVSQIMFRKRAFFYYFNLKKPAFFFLKWLLQLLVLRLL